MRKPVFLPYSILFAALLMAACAGPARPSATPSSTVAWTSTSLPSETPTLTQPPQPTDTPTIRPPAPVRSLEIGEGNAAYLLESMRLAPHDNDVVTALAFSPDGTLLATGGKGGPLGANVWVWDVQTGKLKILLEGHTGDINDLAFINNSWLASASTDHTIRLWDVTTGKVTDTLAAHYDSVTALAVSPDQRWLVSGSKDSSVIVWDMVEKTQSPPMPVPGWPSAIAFGSASNEVAVLLQDGQQPVKIFGIPFLEDKHGLDVTRCSGVLTAMSLSRNGRYLAVARMSPFGPYVGVLNLHEWACFLEIPGNDTEVNSLAYSPDGMLLASAEADGSVRVWKAFTGELLTTLHHEINANDVLFSPDGLLLASAGSDNTVRIWSVPPSFLAENIKTRIARTPTVTSTPPFATPGCAGSFSRLQVGKFARVTAGALPDRVRSEPRVADNVISLLYPEAFGKIIGGPVCADGLVFWQMSADSIPNGSGWVAEGDRTEYWLEPFDPFNP